MLLELSPAVFVNKAKLASWMLFPNKNDEALRIKYRAELNRIRLTNSINNNSVRPDNCNLYYWEQDGDMLVRKERTHLRDDSGHMYDPDNVIGKALDINVGMEIRRKIGLAYQSGFTAGCVLLNCYVNSFYPEDEYCGNKTQADLATEKLMGMGNRSVRKHFSKHAAVAHFWAAYQVLYPEIFIATVESGIKLQLANDSDFANFLDKTDLPNLISASRIFRDFGTGTTATSKSLAVKKNAELKMSKTMVSLENNNKNILQKLTGNFDNNGEFGAIKNHHKACLADKNMLLWFSPEPDCVQDLLMPQELVDQIKNSRTMGKLIDRK